MNHFLFRYQLDHSPKLLNPKGCGISKVANTKIVGGGVAKPGAYPWIALVGHKRINLKGEPFTMFNCGGTLITTRHVLSATHCIVPEIQAKIFKIKTFIRLGEHDQTTTTDGDSIDIDAIKSVGHPSYNKTDKTNDIAILTLEREVIFNDRIRPICLPLGKKRGSKSYVGDNPFVAGWGMLKENGSMSSVLMEVQLPVIDNKQCEDLYEKQNAVYSNNQFSNIVMCAGVLAGGEDGCKGDSGGPLMLPMLKKNNHFRMYQIGVVAYSIGCARPNIPGVYTRVSEFIKWIKAEIGQI